MEINLKFEGFKLLATMMLPYEMTIDSFALCIWVKIIATIDSSSLSF